MTDPSDQEKFFSGMKEAVKNALKELRSEEEEEEAKRIAANPPPPVKDEKNDGGFDPAGFILGAFKRS